MRCNQSDVIRTGSNIQLYRLNHQGVSTWARQLLQLVSKRTQVKFESAVPPSMVGMLVVLFPFFSIFFLDLDEEASQHEDTNDSGRRIQGPLRARYKGSAWQYWA